MWTHREKSDNFIQHDFLIVNLIHCSMACARISTERSIKSKQKDCWSESSRTIHMVAKFICPLMALICMQCILGFSGTLMKWGAREHQNTFAEMKNIVCFVSKIQHTTAINQQCSNESNNFMFRLLLHLFPWVSKAGVPLNPSKSLFNAMLTPHQSHWWNCKTTTKKEL